MNNYQLSVKKYPLYKNSGVEWLGDVPEHWEVRRLKEVSNINKRTLTDKTPDDYEFDYVDIGSVTYGVHGFFSERITFDNSPSRARRIVKQGDTIISTVRTYLKAIASIDDDVSDLIVSTGFAVVSPKKSVFSKYFSYWLTANYTIDEICSLSTGVSYPATNASVISNLFCLIPPLPEQKAIADYLDTKTVQCDRKIDLLSQKAKLYGNLKQSLINETVTRGLDKSVPMKDSEYEWDQEIPKHWQETRVKNIFKLITDLAPNNNNFELLSLYASIGVRPRKDMEQRGNKSVTTDGYWLVKKGDIIVNKLLAWMGSIGLSEYDGVTSPAYDILRKSNEKTDQRFYTYLFRTEKAQAIFKKQSRGIMDVRLRLYFDKFGAISVPFPPPDEQKAITDYLDTKTAQIDQIIQTINAQIEKLKELRKTLINDVVTVKIKVI